MHHHDSIFADPRTWVGVAFVIFFVLFGRKLWGALAGLLDKRAVQVRGELEEAARLRTEAEAILRQARAQRETALADARTMLEQAHAEAARVAEAARNDAAGAAQRRERMAMDRIAAAEKAAVTEVRVAAASVATRAVEKLMSETFTAEQDAAIVDRSIQMLPSALSGRRAA